ncbi:hypothetical protein SLA2020_125230 [Shorea laevis]
MASVAVRMISGNGSSWIQVKDKKTKKMKDKVRVCSASSSVMDPYRTLRIQPDASESEVKKAFRQLALKYHPDVCKGNNCVVQFQSINEAYDTVMTNLRRATEEEEMQVVFDEGDMWDECMGWEGAWVPDYASQINPSF